VICIALWQSRTGGAGSQDVTVGGFVAFISAMLMLIALCAAWPTWPTPSRAAWPRWSAAWACWTRASPKAAAPCARPPSAAIASCRMWRQLRPGQGACAGRCQPHVQPGEVVALVGPSGAGKTTLVNLLPRFLQPTQGQILLDGQPVQDWDLATLRSQFAMVSQDVVMFNDSVAANVALGAEWTKPASGPPGSRQPGRPCARLPEGMHTLVGHNAASCRAASASAWPLPARCTRTRPS
jgi:subfamily B ATP-binding cassette protein MsbA